MSGEGTAESARAVIELAAEQNRRASRLSMAVYTGFFGAFVLGLFGGFSYSLSPGISWGFGVAAVAALTASIFSAALNSRQHKKCAETSKALIETARAQVDSDSMEPLEEGEFMGAYEVLCSDDSMVMMSRNRAFALTIAIRWASLLVGIAAFGAIAAMIFYGGTKTLMNLRGIFLLYVVPGLIALFFALRRSPMRWYASREEMIVRIESVRWIFVREIEDVPITQVEAIYLDQHATVIQSTDGKVHVLQEITIPQLVGLKLDKEEQASAEESVRQLQHSRLLRSLDRVFPGHIDSPDPDAA